MPPNLKVIEGQADERFRFIPALPFISVHIVGLVGVCLVEFSWGAVALSAAMYYLRMFGVAMYHRYFTHRTFQTSRAFQFVLALLGATAAQRGPLWWAGVHRLHHDHADTEQDPHSPRQRGFWWAHLLWFLCPKYNATSPRLLWEFRDCPEILWLNRYWHLVPAALAGLIFAATGLSGLVWGFFFSTVLLWHGTFTVNSLAHLWGRQRYQTNDDSRNNWFLALVVTEGEGWHNNHHHYQASARQGFTRWELDWAYYGLRAFAKLGLVKGIKEPSERALAA